MRIFRILTLGIATVFLLLTSTGEGVAADAKFPTKPIQVIIPFPPGSTDVLLRPFIEKMPEYLGQSMTFIYKPGAAGSVGAGYVAVSKPDGYTLVGVSESALVTVPLTNKAIDYRLESFATISMFVEAPVLLCVKSDSRWKTLRDLIDEAKKNPGQMSFNTSGTYGTVHTAAESLFKDAGIKLTHIPSQGSGASVPALLGGHINASSITLAVILPHVKAGTIRPLVSFTEKRLRALPDVPTAKELGYPVVASSFYGLLAPKGTPRAIVEIIYGAAKKTRENHESFIKERYDNIGVEMMFLGPQEYYNHLKKFQAFQEKILQELSKPGN
jgi:tripartite-type tricarboxylate transporter receptor subunit TctC